MFFGIIPYGHEDEITKRFPVVTVAIVTINLVFFAIIHARIQSAEKRLPQILDKFPKGEVRPMFGPPNPWANPTFARPSPSDIWLRVQAMETEKTWVDYRRGGMTAEKDPEAYRKEQERFEEFRTLVREYEASHRIAYGEGAFEGLAYQGGDKFRIWMPLSSMFVHFGWMHLIGNFIVLMIAGTKVEDLLGRLNFSLLYVLGGCVAAFAHILFGGAPRIPFGGASGAITTLMGVFLIYCYDTRVHFVWFAFVPGMFRTGTFSAPTYFVFSVMILGDVYSAIAGWNAPAHAGGVAHWAHIGGYAFGIGAILAIKSLGLETRLFPMVGTDATGKIVVNHPMLLWRKHDLLEGALALRARGRCIEAAALFEKIAEDHPQASGPLLEAADSYRMARDATRQQASLVAAAQRALRARAEPESLEAYRRLQEAFPGAMLESAEQLQVAATLERAGEYPEAAGALRRLLDTGLQGMPAVKALFRYAQIYEQQFHQNEVALDVYRQALIQAGADPSWGQMIRERMSVLQHARRGASVPPPPPPPFDSHRRAS